MDIQTKNKEKEKSQNCKDKREENSPWWKLWKRRRYVVAVLAFFGFFIICALRVNLSIAIVAMTANTSMVEENGTQTYGQAFDWDSKMQGYILSSFFYGYVTSQILGGWIGTKVGGKRLYGFGIAGTALFTILTPVIVNQSVYLLLATRVVEGILEGLSYPCIQVIWSKWAPPQERTRLATIAMSGMPVGAVVALPFCAYLNNAFRWEGIFYFFGALGMVWASLWWYIVAESPSEDRYISKAELNYITEALAEVKYSNNITYPWKSILTSMAVWAIIVAQFCDNWIYFTLLTELPTYMKDVLKSDLAETGFMSSLPYLISAISLQVSGQLTDFLLTRRILTTTQVRKLVVTIAFIGQLIFLLAAAFTTTTVASTTCISLALWFEGMCESAFQVNALDIAPQYAAVITAISNTIASLTGIISPTVTGYIVTTGTVDEWRIVFYISGVVVVFGCIVCSIFSTGKLQPWAINLQT